MTRALLESALKLSKAERILLAARLWDSIAEEDVPVRLTKAQKAELNRRMRRLDKTGAQGSDWATVRTRVARRAKQP